MDSALSALILALAPGAVATILSIATFIFTQVRSQKSEDRVQKLDDRAAAKETVEVLATLNKALTDEIGNFRIRLTNIEQQHDECEKERLALLDQIRVLKDQIQILEDQIQKLSTPQ
jgi:chromosome segregation ATPase